MLCLKNNRLHMTNGPKQKQTPHSINTNFPHFNADLTLTKFHLISIRAPKVEKGDNLHGRRPVRGFVVGCRRSCRLSGAGGGVQSVFTVEGCFRRSSDSDATGVSQHQ